MNNTATHGQHMYILGLKHATELAKILINAGRSEEVIPLLEKRLAEEDIKK